MTRSRVQGKERSGRSAPQPASAAGRPPPDALPESASWIGRARMSAVAPP